MTDFSKCNSIILFECSVLKETFNVIDTALFCNCNKIQVIGKVVSLLTKSTE